MVTAHGCILWSSSVICVYTPNTSNVSAPVDKGDGVGWQLTTLTSETNSTCQRINPVRQRPENEEQVQASVHRPCTVTVGTLLLTALVDVNLRRIIKTVQLAPPPGP